MKTLEDKLREITDEELGSYTVKYISSGQTLREYNQTNDGKTEEWRNTWWEEKQTCQHCKKEVSRMAMKASHGDLCPLKGIDLDEVKKDWLGGMLFDDMKDKYGQADWFFRNYCIDSFGRRKNGSQNKLTCEHCGTTTNLGNFNRHHGDKCKLKDGKLQDLLKDISDDILNTYQISKKYDISSNLVNKYKNN